MSQIVYLRKNKAPRLVGEMFRKRVLDFKKYLFAFTIAGVILYADFTVGMYMDIKFDNNEFQAIQFNVLRLITNSKPVIRPKRRRYSTRLAIFFPRKTIANKNV